MSSSICWCYGYQQLVESVQGKDADWAAEICGLPMRTTSAVRRVCMRTPRSASIQWGLAFEQQLSALGVTAAACDLMGVTGNIDNPGGNLLIKCAFDIEKRYGLGDFKIPRENYAGKMTLVRRHRVLRHRGLRVVGRLAPCGRDRRAVHAPDPLAAKRQPAFVLGHGCAPHVRGHEQDPLLRGGRSVS